MANKRDPRTDPRPGDVLEDWEGLTRVVLGIRGERVVYRVEGMPLQISCSIERWKRINAESEIIERGND